MSTQGTDARAIAIDHRIAHLLEILQAVAANTKFEMDVRNTGTVAHTFTITDTGSNREGLASNLDQVVQPGGRTTIVFTVKNNVTFFADSTVIVEWRGFFR